MVHHETLDAWRSQARRCLANGVAPTDVQFQSTQQAQSSLFAVHRTAMPVAESTSDGTPPLRLPRHFIADAHHVAVHNDPGRWDLLYRIIWRLSHGEPDLLRISTDDDVLTLTHLCKAVHRDLHKCHAFVRFRKIDNTDDLDGQHWVAWYRPDYRILPLAAPHFIARFGKMSWSILTPDASVIHKAGQTQFGPGCVRQQAPANDAPETLWHVYYKSIFNPARLNRRAMQQEMPRRYWQTMPETEMIDALIKEAPKRTQEFLVAQPAKAPPQLEHADLKALNIAARQCRVCTWCVQCTQVVVGEGPPTARIMLVGEQAGDQEDTVGRPFVGPAGQLLDAALNEAGLDRADVFLTNAVKHFKWVPRGKRRLHQKPNASDVAACRPWLVGEIRLVQPKWLVCLGTTAALAVLGKAVRLKDIRGQIFPSPACTQTLCTTHPSAVLRAAPEAKNAAFAALVADLRLVTCVPS